jgi:TetR/AcrR family transcriptional regulator, transcriptional repressor for nem operon
MRVTKAQAAESRERIIAAAAQAFRERGFDGIGVAELMRSVGLTHGGFYGHFASKEELMALACRRAVADMLADWRARAEAAPGDPAATIVAPYLTAGHRDAPGGGCLMAALGPEAARSAPPVRATVTECLGDVLDTIAAEMPGPDPSERRRQAIRLFASLVGAMVVARAIDDPALSDEILETVRAAIEPSLH